MLELLFGTSVGIQNLVNIVLSYNGILTPLNTRRPVQDTTSTLGKIVPIGSMFNLPLKLEIHGYNNLLQIKIV